MTLKPKESAEIEVDDPTLVKAMAEGRAEFIQRPQRKTGTRSYESRVDIYVDRKFYKAILICWKERLCWWRPST
jgi:hypothetical protein